MKHGRGRGVRGCGFCCFALLAGLLAVLFIWQAIEASAQGAAVLSTRTEMPPRAAQAQRFLVQRGWNARARRAAPQLRRRPSDQLAGHSDATALNPSTAAWQSLGPGAVISGYYGLVTGRVSAIALDPSDSTGNRVYLGTTGGGVWLSQNAATSAAANVAFVPLTDTVSALSTAADGSISIGAITVQPGGTGVVLAGTGDPNDALDSYYGAGILRSADGGTTWKLIGTSVDQKWSFAGEGFAGFAWSTASPGVVVAAVSQAYEGTLTNALRANVSYEGLYYSTDSGGTWSLARITDPNGEDVQGPDDPFAEPGGNAVTSVVWNPVRQLFVAAVRFHGYYQSTDGVNWTRLAAQPGAGLTTGACPTNRGGIGSLGCPIFRGSLAVNPMTGDTFAWTVDLYNQDQGIWQDPCAINGGACGNQNLTFGTKWNTAALETDDPLQGPQTIANGDYNLALAAWPSGQDTILAAGANDLWKCSLAMSCAWRNTTNAFTCMSAQVGPYQHALAWSAANPLEMFIGNDSGLWRSADAIGETGSVCAAGDSLHFQNLNTGLGSLAEVESLSQVEATPYTLMAGLGANGTAGVKSTTGPTTDWPQILGGEGGPVAIDPTNTENWYGNNGAGVSIHVCSQVDDCTPGAFGVEAAVTDADVSGDGYAMTMPAPFLVDPLDATQLLIGTCRVWRGAANGSGWSAANAISPFFDGAIGKGACNGDPLIRTLAAMPLANGGEVIYAGMYGTQDGGETLGGHVFSATLLPGNNGMPSWQDLTLNPVPNDTAGMNAFGMDISSIFIDAHDTTGNTVYVTVEGIPEPNSNLRVVYRSTDGGAHWQDVMSYLPYAAANSVVVDPLDANTVYLATDMGVFSTRQIGSCGNVGSDCWTAYGTGLPEAPVTQLSATPASASTSVLVAGTYGRGIWEIPLWTAGESLTTADAEPSWLTFPAQGFGVPSTAQTVTLTNDGATSLTVSSIAMSGDFSETDSCQAGPIAAGAHCAIQVVFTPTEAGSRSGQLMINANVAGGQISVALSGIGNAPNAFLLSPAAVNFGPVAVGTTSSALQVTVQNGLASAVPVTSVGVGAPFILASNACVSPLAAQSSCQLTVEFAPTQAGSATGALTMVDSAGTQTVGLSGIGAAPATDTLSVSSLSFPGTIVGLNSAAQTVSLTNSGGVALTGITISTAGPFQASSNCTSLLGGNSSCSVGVAFDPAAAGAQSGTLTISDALRTQTVALTGTGLQAPVISTSSTSLSFPAQRIGVASAGLVLSLSNTGGAPMGNLGFQIAGQSQASFRIGSTTCPGILNNGSNCTVAVIFTPVAAGGAAATLTISSSTLGVKAAQVALIGTGQAVAGINVSPAQMTFTMATVGQVSTAQSVAITNTASTAANGLMIAVSAPFSLAQNACGSNLSGGSSCLAEVAFTPVGNGSTQGAMTVTSTTSNSALVLLTGIGGEAGSILIQPSMLNFATTGVGATSSAQVVTITNSGPVAFADLALSVSSGFQLAGTTCTSAIAPGSGCTAGIVFAPTSAGPQTGSLAVTSSALAANVQAQLTGTGFDFAAALNGSLSQTVSSGQTASYMLGLTPMSGSTGTFAFSCGLLPAHAACSFNPASETVAANSTGTVTVQVSTGQAAASSRKGRGLGWMAEPVFCGLILLPVAWRRRRKVLMILAALVIAGGVCSCTGSGGGTGGGTSGGGGTTPAGTYSIPVTISANGVAHTVTLELTVD
ncbi:MAG: choice-of-anchor D domain-containing protein [Terracidiphilus sp.]